MSFKKAYLFITEYLLLFSLASCIGWLYEMACVFIIYGYYFDRGVLHLPMCPIYGVGILLLMLVLVIPMAILGMRVAEKTMKKQAALLE